MTTVFVDAGFGDSARRAQLFAGDLLIFSSRRSVLALVDHARSMIEEAFEGRDPETAQPEMDVQDYAALLADLKPRFIHHPRSKDCIRAILTDFDCDPERTYFDVPRMRTSTSDNYLTTGIAYAFHPHRDTWYSAPFAQQNWWLPIYDVSADNVVAFHPRYWEQGIRNSSRDYDYEEWNRTSRPDAARHIGTDTRKQPKADEEIELDPQLRPVMPVGGMMLFAGAQLHSSVPNISGRTRFSIDFRVVSLDDLEAGHSAPNVDSECRGTTLADFLMASDLATHLPQSLITRYDARPAERVRP